MIYTAIDTFYVTDEQIANSPSRKDGIGEQTEITLRLFGCELIQESGILLRLPQAVMATGQVLFHRFYFKKSFARFNVKRVAASCVWLAAKLEESPRKIPQVLNVFHRMECRRENLPLEPLEPHSKKYAEMKMDLNRTERHLLKEMGFICHVEHPHKFILNYLAQVEPLPELMQEAWNLANDRLDTPCLNDLVYIYYNRRLWVKQLERKIDAKAISLDEIDTTAAWRVEVEDPVIETALDWLEDSGDDHGISEDLDQDVPEDIQFHAESASVLPAEPQSQLEGDRPSGSTNSLPPLPSSRGHWSRGSSSSFRGHLTPVRGTHASRAPTPSARGKALSAAITLARKRGRGNR